MTGFPLVRRVTDQSRFLRFGLVGVLNTAVHYGVYRTLWPVLPYIAAHVIAVSIAMICSYLLNCRYTFRTRPTLRTFALYPLTNLTNIAVSTGTLGLLVEILRVDSRIATLAGGLVAVPATFLLSRTILAECRPELTDEPVETATRR